MWFVHESKADEEAILLNQTKSNQTLELIHTDFSGQIDPPTFDGYNNYMTILDDYTHFTTIYLLKYKSEAGRFLRKFIMERGNELNQKVA